VILPSSFGPVRSAKIGGVLWALSPLRAPLGPSPRLPSTLPSDLQGQVVTLQACGV